MINLDEKWYNHITALPEKEKTVYHVAILDEEVDNGGFNQYFINGYGQFAMDTIISLNLIHANKTALILAKALHLVNQENIDNHIFRRELLLGNIERLYVDEELDDALVVLDEEYSLYRDNLGTLLGNYLRS